MEPKLSVVYEQKYSFKEMDKLKRELSNVLDDMKTYKTDLKRKTEIRGFTGYSKKLKINLLISWYDENDPVKCPTGGYWTIFNFDNAPY